MKRLSTNRSLALLIGALVLADWVSKVWVVNRMAIGESMTVVDGLLYFVHRQNPGVAFSLFAELPDVVRVPALSALSLVGIVLFTNLLRATPDRPARIAAAAVIAGALGNLGDRLLTGGVTDFVLLAFFPFIFNLADAAITLGGSVLALRLFRGAGEVALSSSGSS